MEINQAIEEWLELCPFDDLVVKDENYFNPKNNFNRTKTITLYFDKEGYTEPSDQEMMASFGTKWHDGL